MADENDPNRPEDDPPPKPPEEGGQPDASASDGAPEDQTSPPADHDLFEEQARDTEAPVEPGYVVREDEPADEPEITAQEQAHDEPPIHEPEFGSREETVEAPPQHEPENIARDEEPAPPAHEPEIVGREETPEDLQDSEPQDAAPQEAEPPAREPEYAAREEAAPSSAAPDLPPNYFRAAGDPDEPPEAPQSQLGRAWTRVAQTTRDAWSVAEPHWVKFWGQVRGAGIELWRRVRGVKGPRNLRETAVWSGWAAGGGGALILGFFFFVTWGMPSTDDLWEARQGQSITFLDRNGNVILREGAQNAPPVALGSLPPYVAQAFIAIEDRRFYDHFGVDVGGMMRAGAENMRAGRVVQGGSTITQQLAKNLFLTNDRTWRRKFQEIALAIWLETRFTKEEILALYLSRVYFGAGAYGVEAAAERYFDRPARELTLLQSAVLAGLIKAPSRLNPARQDIGAARDRAVLVLDEMVNMGFISAAEREAATQEELVVSRRNPAGILGYYRDWIDALLNEVIGTQRDDFIVETTLDITAQRAGSQSVEDVLAEQGEARRVGQAALVALDEEGGVRAMVGGRDYDVSQFNRATQARRQPGSSFKFFIYLAAMENGLTPWSVREDAPVTIYIEGQPPWSPRNYAREYNGPTELTRAFALSYNMVAIRVASEVGGENVIDVARRLGVRSPLHNYHSLALGAQEITLLEMAQAYGAMAADGYNLEAHGVSRIRRANNNETMWSFRPTRHERVIEGRPMRYMNLMLGRVVQAGTGTAARIEGRQIGGKTGTGNDYRDAWFIGFVPGYVAAVWVGNDNFTETARVTGGSLPADIWVRFMRVALENVPARELEMPTPEDYDVGLPMPDLPTITAIGAPIGGGDAPLAPPPDDIDRSLDFGPEG